MSIARHHAEWLSLVEVSGPFLSMPVLLETFPQGLEAHDPDHHRLLRLAHDEWEARANQPATHNAWLRFALRKTLDYTPEALVEGQAIPQSLQTEVAEHHEILRPDLVLLDPANHKPRLLIQTYPSNLDSTKPVPGLPWKASPDTRMAELLRKTEVRLGLVTNGERWMLVDAPRGETTGYASWYATLWLEEPITLRAFRSLLGLQRFFGVADDETLEALLRKSAANQQEVTDQLGYQVRRAVEVLIQSLDRADQDHGRELLKGVREAELYEAALTVMMRLVFLFCAEERELLLLGDPLYDQNYAVSTIREQLRTTADQHGEEILERRHDAWCRLLVTFRAVHGGVWHDNFKLPPYGGRLFDPDRFPFLEGRFGSGVRGSWQTTEATPLPVNNRTVLHLLEALQVLQVKVPGGGAAEARRLSFRALDIEQIGHVYEGLLDHTARRASEPHLGLVGTKDREPEIPLARLEELQGKSEKDLLKFLKDETGRTEATLKRALKAEFDAQAVSRFRSACQGDEALWQRVQPFAGLVRLDSFGYPVVIPKGSVFVTEGTDRRSSGTHYTPRSLTEPIVQYTLEPLVYVGPAEGKPKEQWQLKSARELLDLKICDVACGSGAFLVQACRYLSERLLEAWDQAEQAAQPGEQGDLFFNPATQPEGVRITPYGQPSAGGLFEQLVPLDLGERLTYARRIVAQRSLYGVDKNPLAVEMAKLSLWLLTLAKDKPFEFLDHAIRYGDSLVGIHDLRQLELFNLQPDGKAEVTFKGTYAGGVAKLVQAAVELRQKIVLMPSNTVEDVEAQEKLLTEAEEKTSRLRYAADLLLSVEFQGVSAADRRSLHDSMAIQAGYFAENGTIEEFRQAVQKALKGQQTFHWPLEFPEVFQKRGGFDAFMGNPPFMGGAKIAPNLGHPYRQYLVVFLANGRRGHADICCYFLLRATGLLRVGGGVGFLATKTLSQGDTRSVGLDYILSDEFVLTYVISSQKWPGNATIEIAQVVLRNQPWYGEITLNGVIVDQIDAFFSAINAARGPSLLSSNFGWCFSGSKPYGEGFVVTSEEAKSLLAQDMRNSDVVLPYIIGDDLNSSYSMTGRRWIINFGNRDMKEASQYSGPFRIVSTLVKPYRQTVNEQQTRNKWWLHQRSRPELYSSIANLENILSIALTSKTLSPAFISTKQVIDQSIIVILTESYAIFGVMASSVHYWWAIQFGTPMRTDARYSITKCFETFPFPPGVLERGERRSLSTSSEEKSLLIIKVARLYADHRSNIMIARQEGLTKTYNRFHDSDETSPDIKKLRQLHVEMDQAVAAAYGWKDLDLGHGFHETKQGLRYTISEPARREVLARLLKLNHERYDEEVRQGLHEKKGKGSSKKRTPQKSANEEEQPTLFS